MRDPFTATKKRTQPGTDASAHDLERSLSERPLSTLSCFDPTVGEIVERISGDGRRSVEDGVLRARFTGGEGSYQLRLSLPQRQRAGGVGARIRLGNWRWLSYIAIGHTHEGAFAHVKAANPAQGPWFDFIVGHDDLAWGWCNGWEWPGERDLNDIRLYIKGTPEGEAVLEVAEMALWQEDIAALDAHLQAPRLVPARTKAAIRDYQKKCFRTYAQQARAFMEEGKCPLYGEVLLDWPPEAVLPPKLSETGTYQFSWHALHPAVTLMLQAQESGETGPLFAARDFVMGWLERSYDRPDPNLKYAWYDHGTAERCLAMVQLHSLGQQHRFDNRCMSRLRRAIYRHAQLLASEVFYAGHQPTRYHNHAWFQDVALLAVTLAFPAWPGSAPWADTAIGRLEDQFDKLIVRDGGHAVFVENSIGYHKGVQRIIAVAGALAVQSRRRTEIPAIAQELQRFSTFFSYPDSRRTVTQGDTFRLPNPEGPNPRGQVPHAAPGATILPKAGYAVVKGNHTERPFMLTMLATALSRTHKHEDNLAITLYFDGVEWLIDPSFHSHEYTQPVPAYLRSAAAHNCVWLPDRPYSIDPGHARLSGAASGEDFRLEGAHDAYEGVTLTRRLEGRLDRLEIAGFETLSTPQEGAQLRFHCGEHVAAQVANDRVTLTHPGSEFTLVLEVEGGPVTRHRGATDTRPMAGLTGHGFMEVAEIDTLVVDLSGRDSAVWRITVRSSSGDGSEGR